MVHILSISVQAIGAIFLVDFLSGVMHWLEDSYATEETPLIGRFIVKPNIIHHHHPRDFVKSPFWHRNIITAFISGLIFICVAAIFGTSWQLYLCCSLGAICNEFHCWAHRSSEENGPLISTLHNLRILQTPRHHAIHHTHPKNRAYCVLTNIMNPLLDRIELWRVTESFIESVFHVKPRPDLSVPPRDP